MTGSAASDLRAARRQTAPSAARPAGGAARPRLRLTRRGRLVIQVALILFVSGLAALAATASQASHPANTSLPTVVVQPHDTLWSIASRHAGGRDPRAVVADIRRLNGLTGTTVHPGHRLALPR